MRGWLLRLRTALAVAAAVFLALELPALYHSFRQPLGETPIAPSPTILRVWLSEDFSGTAPTWLSSQAALFEKATRDTRVVVRRAQREDWLAEGTVLPDLLLFEAGTIDNPEALLAPLGLSLDIKPFLASTGDWQGRRYAVPIAYSGYVLLTNESKPDGPALQMHADKEYQEFASGQAHSLIATPREVRRLFALQEKNRGVLFAFMPYGTRTDKLLFAGLCNNGGGERADAAETFLTFLLADLPQNALPESGLLPASETALLPDAEKQPLLYALAETIDSAAGAFSQEPPD